YMAAHNNLGLALERQGRFAEAMASYDRAVEIDHHCLQAVTNLANVLDRLGQPAAAALVRAESVELRAAG
ncbi:MAG TPA: tetratricopeptide repeat protein, partial [Pirellulales bacterium]|nr:tetratricopeptide repeat protein [Pirellulales bacterium]